MLPASERPPSTSAPESPAPDSAAASVAPASLAPESPPPASGSPQICSGGLHMYVHCPSEQTWLTMHACPHEPQSWGSCCRPTQQPSQVCEGAHAASVPVSVPRMGESTVPSFNASEPVV